MAQVENDDWPIFTVRVTHPGADRVAVFALYRRLLGVGPAEAKRLLDVPSVDVARGPRMNIEEVARELIEAGAEVRVTS